jgi:hypothetical protein
MDSDCRQDVLHVEDGDHAIDEDPCTSDHGERNKQNERAEKRRQCGGAAKTNDGDHTFVQISLKDWNDMKKQNEDILRVLEKKKNKKKRKHANDEDMHSSSKSKRKRTETEKSRPILPRRTETVTSAGLPRRTQTVTVDSGASWKAHDQSTDNGVSRKTNEPDVEKMVAQWIDQNPQNDAVYHSQSDGELGDIEQEILQLKQEFESEPQTGESLPDSVAQLFNVMAKASMSNVKHDEKVATYKRPENFEVEVMKVNSELWEILSKSAKAAENRIQAAELDLYTATYALGQVATKCMSAQHSETRQLLKPVTDASGLVLKAIHDLNIDRRLRIVNALHMHKKYNKLATGDMPLKGLLFGPSLEWAKKEIDSAKRLSESLAQSQSKNFRYQYNRGGSFSRGLPQRGRSPYRARGALVTRGRGRARGYGYTQTQRGQYKNAY